MTQPESDPSEIAVRMSGTLQRSEPGELAALRRMQGETGAPLFWRLVARHDLPGWQRDDWMEIVRTLAILTPTGAPEERLPLHDGKRRLGAVLCDGGNPDWPAAPQPMLSEKRLAQLLAARGDRRRDALVRTARMLARARRPDAGVNVADIAWAVINPNGGGRIAKDYYDRLDRAEYEAKRDNADA